MEVKPKTFNRAKEYSLYLLEKSMKTEMEIRRKLKSKDYSKDIIDKAIDFLKQYSFINDEEYTDYFIKEKKGKQSIKKIKFDLLKKGIDKNLIDDKLNFIGDNEEYNSAYNCAFKKIKSLYNYDNEDKKKKLFDFLYRKGYDYEIVKKVVNNITESE